jgi:hypothetical protein
MMGIIIPGLYIFTSLADQPISSFSEELHRFEAELNPSTAHRAQMLYFGTT